MGGIDYINNKRGDKMIGFAIVLGLVATKRAIYAFVEQRKKDVYYEVVVLVFCLIVFWMELAR